MGAGIGWSENVIRGKDGCGIRTREVNGPVDDGIWFSLVQHRDGYGEWCAGCHVRGSGELQGRVGGTATDRHPRCQSYTQSPQGNHELLMILRRIFRFAVRQNI